MKILAFDRLTKELTLAKFELNENKVEENMMEEMYIFVFEFTNLHHSIHGF